MSPFVSRCFQVTLGSSTGIYRSVSFTICLSAARIYPAVSGCLACLSVPTFFAGRQVQIRVSRHHGKETAETGKETAFLNVGYMGTLHVDCLRAFGLAVPGERAVCLSPLLLVSPPHEECMMDAP